jgi:hypothetical protein
MDKVYCCSLQETLQMLEESSDWTFADIPRVSKRGELQVHIVQV